MKYLCLLLTLASLPIQAASFYEPEGMVKPTYLTPARERTNAYAQLLATKGSIASLLAFPSFQADWAIAVDETIPDGIRSKYPHRNLVPQSERLYSITMTEASSSKEGAPLSRWDRQISLELAIAIQRAWARMLLLTRYPAGVSRGLDGTTYRFSTFVRGMGDLEGETWSPDEGLPAEMVALGESLKDFTVKQIGTEEELIARLQAFEAKLPNPHQI